MASCPIVANPPLVISGALVKITHLRVRERDGKITPSLIMPNHRDDALHGTITQWPPVNDKENFASWQEAEAASRPSARALPRRPLSIVNRPASSSNLFLTLVRRPLSNSSVTRQLRHAALTIKMNGRMSCAERRRFRGADEQRLMLQACQSYSLIGVTAKIKRAPSAQSCA